MLLERCLPLGISRATYGALPEAGLVDTLKEDQRLTVVGYGASGFDCGGGPGPLPRAVYPDDRYRATVRLLNTKDAAVRDMFIKTTGVSLIKREGEGTCTGVSGGPLFLPEQQTIVDVTSFGVRLWCRGSGYFQRMDLPRVLNLGPFV